MTSSVRSIEPPPEAWRSHNPQRGRHALKYTFRDPRCRMLPSNASDFEVTNPQAKKSGGPGAGLFFTIGLLVLLIGVIAYAVTRLPTGTLSRPAPAAAPTALAVVNGVTAEI